MSVLSPVDGMNYWDRQAWRLGEKIAADQVPAYNLAGRLYVSAQDGKPWGLLSVPNALVRGIFSAMTTPGIELPLNKDGQLVAHISVFRPSEIAMLGGPDALLNDRGKSFKYTIGRLVEFEPAGWEGVSKVFALRVHSPELQVLRRSYGLSGLPVSEQAEQYDFHVTAAIKRRGVTGRTDTAKDTTAA